MSITQVGLYFSLDQKLNDEVRQMIWQALCVLGYTAAHVELIKFHAFESEVDAHWKLPTHLHVSEELPEEIKHMIYVQEVIDPECPKIMVRDYANLIANDAYKLLQRGVDTVLVKNPYSIKVNELGYSMPFLSEIFRNIPTISFARYQAQGAIDSVRDFFKNGSSISIDPINFDGLIISEARNFTFRTKELLSYKDSQDEVREKISKKKQEQ